jgi:hypothetical protein
MAKTWRERLEWLGRMPRHYKLLFGSQIVFTIFALRMRQQRIVQKRQMELREGKSDATF